MILDWGDMTRGDRAGDLAAVWMLLPEQDSRRAMAALPDVSEATWRRARAWAVSIGVMLIDADTDPALVAVGRRIFANLLDGP